MSNEEANKQTVIYDINHIANFHFMDLCKLVTTPVARGIAMLGKTTTFNEVCGVAGMGPARQRMLKAAIRRQAEKQHAEDTRSRAEGPGVADPPRPLPPMGKACGPQPEPTAAEAAEDNSHGQQQPEVQPQPREETPGVFHQDVAEVTRLVTWLEINHTPALLETVEVATKYTDKIFFRTPSSYKRGDEFIRLVAKRIHAEGVTCKVEYRDPIKKTDAYKVMIPRNPNRNN